MLKFFLFGIFLVLALALRLALFGFNPEVKISQGPVVFEAVLKQSPQLNGRGQVLSFANVKVYTEFEPQYRIGDVVRIDGVVDSRYRIFRSKVSKVSKGAKVDKSRFAGSNVIAKLRGRIADNIAQVLPKKEAILVQGTILGVDNIDYGFRQELIKTGTIHVVVVSGQNMAIAAGIFLAFARYLGRRLAVVLALVGVLCYATIAGFQPPVVRAAIMVSAATIATLFGREIWPMWSLMLAAYAIIFVNPAAALEISFQLTFAATLGIMTLGRSVSQWVSGSVKIGNIGKSVGSVGRTSSKSLDSPTYRFTDIPIHRLTEYLFGESLAVAISAYLFTAPLIIFYFGRISVLAPLVNILVIVAVTPIMVIGFFLAIVSLIWMPLAQIVAMIAYVPAFYFVKVVEIFAAITFGQAEFGMGNAGLLVLLYMVVLGITGALYGKTRDK